ncbi:MAG: hypothetical protein MUQ30_07680, partial [Anaerolineae bacterium]|nr:hypothetical protein [Anaerolineae bacterium]
MAKQTAQIRLGAEQRASQSPKLVPSSKPRGLALASAEPVSCAMGKPPPVVAFVGLSGSGKTTLLLKL